MICSVIVSAFFFVVVGNVVVPPVQIGPFDNRNECEEMQLVFEKATACWEDAAARKVVSIGIRGCVLAPTGGTQSDEGESNSY